MVSFCKIWTFTAFRKQDLVFPQGVWRLISLRKLQTYTLPQFPSLTIYLNSYKEEKEKCLLRISQIGLAINFNIIWTFRKYYPTQAFCDVLERRSSLILWCVSEQRATFNLICWYIFSCSVFSVHWQCSLYNITGFVQGILRSLDKLWNANIIFSTYKSTWTSYMF